MLNPERGFAVVAPTITGELEILSSVMELHHNGNCGGLVVPRVVRAKLPERDGKKNSRPWSGSFSMRRVVDGVFCDHHEGYWKINADSTIAFLIRPLENRKVRLKNERSFIEPVYRGSFFSAKAMPVILIVDKPCENNPDNKKGYSGFISFHSQRLLQWLEKYNTAVSKRRKLELRETSTGWYLARRDISCEVCAEGKVKPTSWEVTPRRKGAPKGSELLVGNGGGAKKSESDKISANLPIRLGCTSSLIDATAGS